MFYYLIRDQEKIGLTPIFGWLIGANKYIILFFLMQSGLDLILKKYERASAGIIYHFFF